MNKPSVKGSDDFAIISFIAKLAPTEPLLDLFMSNIGKRKFVSVMLILNV